MRKRRHTEAQIPSPSSKSSMLGAKLPNWPVSTACTSTRCDCGAVNMPRHQRPVAAQRARIRKLGGQMERIIARRALEITSDIARILSLIRCLAPAGGHSRPEVEI
jgi:hypothetical protein